MKIFDANISTRVLDYFSIELNMVCARTINQRLKATFGIVDFFENDEELVTFKKLMRETSYLFFEPDRAEYGDFQTNTELANKIIERFRLPEQLPDIVVEPTCGKGNFIVAALQHLETIKKIIGVEIYKPYVWECKFNILDFYLQHPPRANKPDIFIAHSSVFDFDFKAIAKAHVTEKILIVGNPPWVTNSKLGSLNSDNLPKKSNFKHLNGLDAMTGKGNFDIAESIVLLMLSHFQKMNGTVALLVKNTVVRNIVFDQNKNKFLIAKLEKYAIDSKKEFNVAVEAALFVAQLNAFPAFECKELSLYDATIRNGQHFKNKFGWIGDKFVSDIEAYAKTQQIDGICPFEWRQGIKHDCAAVMELEPSDGNFVNGLGEIIPLENDLVYGLLKSSDLKNTVIHTPRKFTIVTQKKVGQETAYIKDAFPKTHQYLTKHQDNFNARKSSIYQNKPPFSIFGVGDYSFKPYKVAISGLYKTFHFTLVLPHLQKPVMLDDTCYLIGFEQLEFAVYALLLLNNPATKQFLKAITFSDAKRPFTKEVLMRIDLLQLSKTIDKTDLNEHLNRINQQYSFDLSLNKWKDFVAVMSPQVTQQISLF